MERLIYRIMLSRTKGDRVKVENPYRRYRDAEVLQRKLDVETEKVQKLTNLLSGRRLDALTWPKGPVYVADRPCRIALQYAVAETEAGRVSLIVDADEADWEAGRFGHIELEPGLAHQIRLPDGATLDIAADGTYTVNAPDRPEPVYGPPEMRPFNPFLHTSDRIGEFIEALGELGVRQDQILRVPLEAFIVWLAAQAAEADGEKNTDLPPLEKVPAIARLLKPEGTDG